MRYPIEGNLALKEELTTDIDVRFDSGAPASPIDYRKSLFDEEWEPADTSRESERIGFQLNWQETASEATKIRHDHILAPAFFTKLTDKKESKDFEEHIEYQSVMPSGQKIILIDEAKNMDIDMANRQVDKRLGDLTTGLKSGREQAFLRETELVKLENILSKNNSQPLVYDFMRALRYAVFSTFALMGDRITKIILRGDVLQDTADLSDSFSLDIELFIILNTESYCLSDIVVVLADNVYGSILCKKGLLFINTILSEKEWSDIASNQDKYLVLMEKERVLQKGLYKESTLQGSLYHD